MKLADEETREGVLRALQEVGRGAHFIAGVVPVSLSSVPSCHG